MWRLGHTCRTESKQLAENSQLAARHFTCFLATKNGNAFTNEIRRILFVFALWNVSAEITRLSLFGQVAITVWDVAAANKPAMTVNCLVAHLLFPAPMIVAASSPTSICSTGSTLSPGCSSSSTLSASDEPLIGCTSSSDCMASASALFSTSSKNVQESSLPSVDGASGTIVLMLVSISPGNHESIGNNNNNNNNTRFELKNRWTKNCFQRHIYYCELCDKSNTT